MGLPSPNKDAAFNHHFILNKCMVDVITYHDGRNGDDVNDLYFSLTDILVIINKKCSFIRL